MRSEKHIHCAYLYADGHAVLVWKKRDPEAGEIEWVELHEKWCNAKMRFEGRIVLHNPEAYLGLAKRAYSIEADAGSVENGSDNTRRLGLKVGHVNFNMSGEWMARNCVRFTLLPDLISSDFCVQPETKETWAEVSDLYHWGMSTVGKVHRTPKAEPISTAQAA